MVQGRQAEAMNYDPKPYPEYKSWEGGCEFSYQAHHILQLKKRLLEAVKSGDSNPIRFALRTMKDIDGMMNPDCTADEIINYWVPFSERILLGEEIMK